MDQIINGTGRDRITLWYLGPGGVRKRRFTNRSWIFVHGDPFDLDFLARQLDVSPFDYSWERKRDVYGEMEGIVVHAMPSRIGDVVRSAEQVGLNRKFRIFNGDIDPVMRFMSERDLEFFHLETPYDMDPAVESMTVGGKSRRREVERVHIDGESYPPTGSTFDELMDRMNESDVIVYDNTNEVFRKILYLMRDRGMHIPGIWTKGGSTYQSYGQLHYKSPTVGISGKICIPSDSFVYAEAGLPGIFELSRTASLPPVSASIVTPGTAVSTMEESIALKNGILIPLYKDDHEVEKSVAEVSLTDRGGIALQPEPGIYSDVYEIDFSSMYPSIIVRYNLSPETIGKRGDYSVPDTPHMVDNSRNGFLPLALSGLLKKRLFYKSIREDSEVYRNRDTALKWMLLTSFGYTGYKNAKFGKIEAHESITSIGRSVLSRAMKLAEDSGFSVIHGIVDSLWIKGRGDVVALMQRIKDETRIDIVQDGHYRWIAFFQARSGLGSLNRYIGMRTDGTYKIRGIELRRKDVPELSKKFQLDALSLFEDCRTVRDIAEKYDDLQELERRYLDNLCNFPRELYRIRMKVTRRADEYRVRNVQKIALEKLLKQGIEVNPGERVPVIVTDRRREIVDLDSDYEGIDAEFYRRHLYRAFECFDYLVSRASAAKKRKTASLMDPDFAVK